MYEKYIKGLISMWFNVMFIAIQNSILFEYFDLIWFDIYQEYGYEKSRRLIKYRNTNYTTLC